MLPGATIPSRYSITMNYGREVIESKKGRATLLNIQTNEQNSLTRENMIELEKILTEMQADDQVRAVVLSSDNPKFFSNGLDAANILNTPRDRLTEEVSEIITLFGHMLRFDKPLIAEVGGYAMGGGAVMSLACDFRYMLEGKGRMAFTEVLVGLPLPLSIIQKLRTTIDLCHLNSTCLLATMYRAAEAKAVGLIDDIATTREELRRLVMSKLDDVLSIAPSAYRKTKQVMNKNIVDDFETTFDYTKKICDDPSVAANLIEGATALKEKRRPRFV